MLDSHLDYYKTDPESYGYKLLRGIQIPRGNAVGDTVGLFPIAYLNKVTQNPTADDWKIIRDVALQYIMGWPMRLPDGTFSRHVGWSHEPDHNASFLWADDQYMGLVLLARLGASEKNTSMILETAKLALQYASRLEDKLDRLYYHGYNDADGHVSCCKWGRANGWAAWAHVEILQALSTQPSLSKSVQFKRILQLVRAHLAALAKHQSFDGRFHQVINESSTYLETSATAMILSPLARSVTYGWLSQRKYSDVIERAWKGLTSTVDVDGTVRGICMGTGIIFDQYFYGYEIQ